MIRLNLGLVFAAFVAHAASASGILPPTQAAKIHADTHCAALGSGFFPVAGSNACIKISGHISAGAAFGTGAARSDLLNSAAGGGAHGFNAQAAASGDLRFDAPFGPARIYVEGVKNTNRRWIDDSQ